MKALVKKFFDEPVFALAIVQGAAAAVALYVKDTKATVAAGIVIAVCEAAKRQLVTPEYEG